MSAKYRLIGPLWANDVGKNILRAAAQETLEYGKGVIRGFTPVRSGQLQDGWKVDQTALYNDVPYSRWVDEGTSRMKARGMTQRSIPQIESFYLEAIQKHVQRLN